MRSNSPGTAALKVLGGAGSRLRMPSNTTAVVPPGKLCLPVAIWYSTTPNENRSVRGSTSSPRRPAVFGRQFGETEVEHLHGAPPRDEDVGGLHVTVKNALGVRGVERIGHLRGDVEHEPHVEWLARQLAIQGIAVEQLHGEIELAVVLIETVDRADCWDG